jgi:histone-lysine N-methyltransferase SUV420H
MSATASTARVHGVLTWRPTKIMHIQDLPKDDDFLSHLLIEKLGTGTVPLLVHRMDPSRRLPKTHTADLMKIVRRVRVQSLFMFLSD